MTDFVTKLTLKTLGCKPQQAKTEDKKIHLARIIGVATGLKAKVDNRGEPIEAILGNFEGTNIVTGESQSSAVLYLPGGIHDAIVQPLKGENAAESVQFAFDIYAIPATNPIGYSYTAQPLVKSSEHDPLDALRKSLPALPAPAKAAAKK